MKGFLAGLVRFIGGKEVGAFTKMGGKTLIGEAMRQAKTPVSLLTAHNSWQAFKMNLVLGLPAIVLTPGTPEEKLKSAGLLAATSFMTLGMNSPWRQFGWGMAMSLLPMSGAITRGIVQGYRGALESRTSLAIPFSHSNLAMDQAFATMQYSQQRVSDAYSNVGFEAAYFAARYTSR